MYDVGGYWITLLGFFFLFYSTKYESNEGSKKEINGVVLIVHTITTQNNSNAHPIDTKEDSDLARRWMKMDWSFRLLAVSALVEAHRKAMNLLPLHPRLWQIMRNMGEMEGLPSFENMVEVMTTKIKEMSLMRRVRKLVSLFIDFMIVLRKKNLDSTKCFRTCWQEIWPGVARWVISGVNPRGKMIIWMRFGGFGEVRPSPSLVETEGTMFATFDFCEVIGSRSEIYRQWNELLIVQFGLWRKRRRRGRPAKCDLKLPQNCWRN